MTRETSDSVIFGGWVKLFTLKRWFELREKQTHLSFWRPFSFGSFWFGDITHIWTLWSFLDFRFSSSSSSSSLTSLPPELPSLQEVNTFPCVVLVCFWEMLVYLLVYRLLFTICFSCLEIWNCWWGSVRNLNVILWFSWWVSEIACLLLFFFLNLVFTFFVLCVCVMQLFSHSSFLRLMLWLFQRVWYFQNIVLAKMMENNL